MRVISYKCSLEKLVRGGGGGTGNRTVTEIGRGAAYDFRQRTGPSSISQRKLWSINYISDFVPTPAKELGFIPLKIALSKESYRCLGHE